MTASDTETPCKRSCLTCARAILEIKDNESYFHCAIDATTWKVVRRDHAAFTRPIDDAGPDCDKYEEGHPVEVQTPFNHDVGEYQIDLSEISYEEYKVLQEFSHRAHSSAFDAICPLMDELRDLENAEKQGRFFSTRPKPEPSAAMQAWGAWA